MSNYPPYKINSVEKQVNILQITDLHLSTYGDCILANTDVDIDRNYDCQRSFEAVLKQALNEDIRCDLILVTGDLVNQVKPAIYDHIFGVLTVTGVPFACIAGNHDVTDEVGQDLPFDERRLVARDADARLLSRHVIETDYWQIILLDSSVAGKISGKMTNEDIDWLCQRLKSCHKSSLLAIHHHVLPMQSAWIDAHIVQNAEHFWQTIKGLDNLRVIINGHTHQEQTEQYDAVMVYTTPSTCYQYQPFEDDFAYDTNAAPGYRWLQLANNGQVASWVKRLDT